MSKIIKTNLYGSVFFVVLVVFPVVLWLSVRGLDENFSSAPAAIKSLGKAAALMGFAAYCLQPVLSMRFLVIEKLFGGLDSVFKLHKQAGKIAFYLICAHPILLAISGFLGGKNLGKIWDWSALYLLIGILAFFSVILLVLLTIYAHLKHQNWVMMHRLLGWVMPLIVAHTILASAQVTKIVPLFIYMLLLAEIGFASFLIRSVFVALIRRYRYEVVEVVRVSPMVTELVLRPVGIPINYSPGQFAFLTLIGPGIDSEPHPYSFTTGNNGPYVRFAIKNLGDDTAKIKDILPGTKALLEGPHGSFSLSKSSNRNQIWIAGGVGITPFLSMARSLRTDNEHKIHLYYAANKLDDAPFLSELIAIRKSLPDSFDFTLVNKEWSGFVNTNVLNKDINELKDCDFLLCGPPVMMTSLKKELAQIGIKRQQIFTEEFSFK